MRFQVMQGEVPRRRLAAIRLVTGVVLISLAPFETARTQEPAVTAAISPVNDLIEKANSALNNLKYDEALGFAREALSQRRIRPAQSLVINQLMAAAFYPDPDDGGRNQQADSAIFYLRRAIKQQPDVQLADVYRWAGIDSLFRVTKSLTFAAIARPAAENALIGKDGRAFVEVISTRDAVMYLRTRSVRDGVITTHDSSDASTRSRLALRAHDGEVPLFVTGDYEVRIEIRDVRTGQMDTLLFVATAVGAPPAIDRVPIMSPEALKPERAKKSRAKGIAAGLIIGTGTVAMSIFARAKEPIRSAYSADGRAQFVGLVIAAGAIAGGVFDRGMPLPGNVAANVLARAEHTRAVTLVQDANRKRVAEYRVTLRIDLESAR